MSDHRGAVGSTARGGSARERPWLALFALAAIAGLSIASALLMEHAAWGAFAAFALLLATWRFFVPRVESATDSQSEGESERPRCLKRPGRSESTEQRGPAEASHYEHRRTDRRSVLRYAFAVDPPGPAEPTDEERPIVEALVREVARRGMTTPAIAFLEMSRPLNYVASQTLTFFGPVLSAITDSRGHAHLAAFLERRGSIDWLLERLEAVDAPQRE